MQEQIKKQKKKKAQEQPEEIEVISDSELIDDVDAILDELDLVLEENAQAFVKNYVQKGGE